MRIPALRSWLVGLVVALAALALAIAPAAAHSQLESSDPADGATLDAPPEVLSFTFNEELLQQGNAVTLTEVATGTRLELGAVVVSGDTVSVAWPQASPAGEYRAAYRVVSADGHPIDGTVTFTVAQAVGRASASPAAEPAGPSSAEPSSADGGGIAAWALGIGAVVLAGVAGGVLVLRRGR